MRVADLKNKGTRCFGKDGAIFYPDMLEVVPEYQEACHEQGLSTTGSKKVLAKRLIDHDPANAERMPEHTSREFEASCGNTATMKIEWGDDYLPLCDECALELVDMILGTGEPQ